MPVRRKIFSVTKLTKSFGAWVNESLGDFRYKKPILLTIRRRLAIKLGEVVASVMSENETLVW